MKIPGGASLSRKEIDDYTDFVGVYGAKGLAWVKVNDLGAGIEGLQSPILKFMPDDTVLAMLSDSVPPTATFSSLAPTSARLLTNHWVHCD